MIRRLEVTRLYGRFDYDFDFYEDLNLFTGDMGSGKTTLLKLIWFLTSGNLQRVISEIPFETVSIETSKFSLSMEMDQSDPARGKLIWQPAETNEKLEVSLDLKRVSLESTEFMVLEPNNHVEKFNKEISHRMESSLFFPTYRRIESYFVKEILGDTISTLAEEFSFGNHKFQAAISTYDIIEMLTEKHTTISEGVGRTDDEYETLCERWSELETLVSDMFGSDYGGIRLTESLILPCDSEEEVILSAYLSSGEKQLLGLLSYNAFSEDKTIFIDEPELSMHPDWQRLLFRILKSQGTEKQFFAATHSPMIGATYKDKQIPLRTDSKLY